MMEMNMSNSSFTGDCHPHSWNSGELIHAVLLGLVFLLGVPGNITIITFRPNIQHLSPVTQSLMVNLAVSDLLCLLTIPFWIYAMSLGWTPGLVPCKLLTYLSLIGIYGSLMTVTLLSVQRYLGVVKQWNMLNRFGAKRLLVLVWTASLIASIPTCVHQQLIIEDNRIHCLFLFTTEPLVMVVLIEEITGGFITMFIVAFSYISVYRKVKQAAFFNHPQTTRLVSSITVIFFILYFPYHVNNILSVTAISLNISELRKSCNMLRYIWGSVVIFNSSLNPLLYAFTSCNLWKCTEKRICWGRNSGVFQRKTNGTIYEESVI
uniref:G-protein coupled receptors family 1 profile domain-containing protein n=1 Tax=Oryzias melastigma TaxID=30732 RepID=A0A3B3DU49_ORYME